MRNVMIACFLIAAGSHADHWLPVENYEKVIIPIFSNNAFDGKYGARWATLLTVRNAAGVPVEVTDGPSRGHIAICPPHPCRRLLDPHTTLVSGHQANSDLFHNALPEKVPGIMGYVEKAHSDNIHFSLELRTLPSRDSVELPVVREREFLTRTAHLLNVPVAPTHRIAVRVYDADSRGDGAVRVSVFGLRSIVPVGVVDMALPNTGHVDPKVRAIWPGYGAILDLHSAFPAIAHEEAIRIELEPLTPGLRFWGFVSVTDNVTHHVRLVTAQ